jgi:hypothetical protein
VELGCSSHVQAHYFVRPTDASTVQQVTVRASVNAGLPAREVDNDDSATKEGYWRVNLSAVE